jgi:hypothetical protein
MILQFHLPVRPSVRDIHDRRPFYFFFSSPDIRRRKGKKGAKKRETWPFHHPGPTSRKRERKRKRKSRRKGRNSPFPRSVSKPRYSTVEYKDVPALCLSLSLSLALVSTSQRAPSRPTRRGGEERSDLKPKAGQDRTGRKNAT